MLLYEFLTFQNSEINIDRRYDATRDKSVRDYKDSRKPRLTLRQINQMRLQSESHIAEKTQELEFIKQMYGAPVEEGQGTTTA
jgi:hypothetical protein